MVYTNKVTKNKSPDNTKACIIPDLSKVSYVNRKKKEKNWRNLWTGYIDITQMKLLQENCSYLFFIIIFELQLGILLNSFTLRYLYVKAKELTKGLTIHYTESQKQRIRLH